MTTHELALWAIKGMLEHAGDAPSPATAKQILDIVDESLNIFYDNDIMREHSGVGK